MAVVVEVEVVVMVLADASSVDSMVDNTNDVEEVEVERLVDVRKV